MQIKTHPHLKINSFSSVDIFEVLVGEYSLKLCMLHNQPFGKEVETSSESPENEEIFINSYMKLYKKCTIKSEIHLFCANKFDYLFNIVHSLRQLAVWKLQ